MDRLRDLGLEPVEYPHTRVQGTPAERAADLNAAFADPSVRAVLATVGGDDQITVLKHLDDHAMTADPKRFIGYSDNTNLSNWLFARGIGSIYGGSPMVHMGPGPAIDPLHEESLRAALFGGDLELRTPSRTADFGLGWENADCLSETAPDWPAEPWTWAGASRSVTGTVWGGCLEIVEWTLAVGRYVLPPASYADCVLALESSEERPPPDEVFRMLRNLGERGILGQAAALLWGRPPVTQREDDVLLDTDQRAERRSDYRDAVLRAVADYGRDDLVVVMDVDFGHTIPQLLLPYGGQVTVDGSARRLVAHFG